tara:strand:- start:370 stop:1005 length:636 start_codon:yes stop_codon:yes gene_type:complete
MTITPTEVMNLDSVSLGADVTKGLVPAQVQLVRESVVEINEELTTAGQCLRAVAAHLSDIKANVKPGNWRAFLKSGAINCSERFAVDLVSAHESWLAASEADDYLLAGLSARSLQIMGSKGATEQGRQKVFEAVDSGEKVTESYVRLLVKGKKAAKKQAPKTVDAKVTDLEKKNAALKATIRELNTLLRQKSDQIRQLEKSNVDKLEAILN